MHNFSFSISYENSIAKQSFTSEGRGGVVPGVCHWVGLLRSDGCSGKSSLDQIELVLGSFYWQAADMKRKWESVGYAVACQKGAL